MPYLSKLVSKRSPQGPREAAAAAAAEPPSRPGTWRLAVGAALLCYGLFDSYLFTKFTPVYRSTHCGDQVADLRDFSLGDGHISVGLKISLTCQNPNSYAVEIASSSPGHVYAGADRALDLGTVTLVEGSTLPASSAGTISVEMAAQMPVSSTGAWISRFLSDPVVPLFLELHFDVAISMNFGVASFGTTAPFSKRCGLHLSGMLISDGERLGPLICRESFEEVEDALREVRRGEYEAMTFSAAQMDPERIAMGEALKNVSIIGMGILCFSFGTYLVTSWYLQHRGEQAQALAAEAEAEAAAPQGLLASAAELLGSLSPYGRVALDEELGAGSPGSPGAASWLAAWSPGRASRSTAASESSPASPAPGRLSPVMTLLTCKRTGKPRTPGSSPASPWLEAA